MPFQPYKIVGRFADWKRLGTLVLLFVVLGCSAEFAATGSESAALSIVRTNRSTENSPERLHSNSPTLDDADLRILFIGNSHTLGHDLDGLVADLIRFRRPNSKAATESIMVGFLEQAETTPATVKRLTKVKWDKVVLQAQKISASARTEYSTAEGIAFARRAIKSGAKVHFFAEWGIQGDAKNADHTDGVYRKMATEAEAALIPVTRVWTRVLAESPDLALYSEDGNHQSRLGASLTALTIAAFLLEESPEVFADFPDPVATPAQWATFVKAATAEWESQRDAAAPESK